MSSDEKMVTYQEVKSALEVIKKFNKLTHAQAFEVMEKGGDPVSEDLKKDWKFIGLSNRDLFGLLDVYEVMDDEES